MVQPRIRPITPDEEALLLPLPVDYEAIKTELETKLGQPRMGPNQKIMTTKDGSLFN